LRIAGVATPLAATAWASWRCLAALILAADNPPNASYYVSLGDSLATGFQPGDNEFTGGSHGYPISSTAS
jgi:hypothetical protein